MPSKYNPPSKTTRARFRVMEGRKRQNLLGRKRGERGKRVYTRSGREQSNLPQKVSPKMPNITDSEMFPSLGNTAIAHAITPTTISTSTPKGHSWAGLTKVAETEHQHQLAKDKELKLQKIAKQQQKRDDIEKCKLHTVSINLTNDSNTKNWEEQHPTEDIVSDDPDDYDYDYDYD